MGKMTLQALLFPLFWLLSPDALVILGNSAGYGGTTFVFALSIAFLLSFLVLSLLNNPKVKASSAPRFASFASNIGIVPAMTITLASRFTLVLLLPTGMLVTAGFTFNETFVYWFPNFGFSFLLLFLILALHLAGERWAKIAQFVFLGITLCSLALLIFFGLVGTPSSSAVPAYTPPNFSVSPFLTCTILLLFLGYAEVELPTKKSVLFLAIATGPLIIGLWGGVSLKFLDPTKLVESTIPYVQVSRNLLGQPGRIIIGITIISGTAAMVNGLFFLCSNSLQAVASHISFPITPRYGMSSRLLPLVFSLLIAIFLATGLAGDEFIDTYIFCALLLWLLLIGMYCFAATVALQKIKDSLLPHYLLISATVPCSALYLAYQHEQSLRILSFIIIILTLSAVVSICWLFLKNQFSTNCKATQQGDHL